jgi:predicted ATPase
MVDTPQYKYLTIDLDPRLLSTHFKIQTNWHVITGAACTGKTTLINQLAEKGYQTFHETAREFFEIELAKGRTLEEILEKGLAVQKSIFEMQLTLEHAMQSIDFAFLDRAIPDSLTFHRIFGYDPNELLPECFHYRYASVFILDRLSLQREETLGPEDDASSRFLDEWLVRDYNALGYKIVRVPALSPQERLSFILDRVPDQRLNSS